MRFRKLLAEILTGAAFLAGTGCASDTGGDASDATVIIPPDAVGSLGGSEAPDAQGIPTAQACDDGEDNDTDGVIDLDDPGCEGISDDDETDPVRATCENGADDDADGLADLDDPGCAFAGDEDESDDPAPPQCNDQQDNDADGYTDFPDDPGCGSDLDGDETNDLTALPACADGEDNDRDGESDLQDPGCSSPADPREEDPDVPPACSNRLDDDADGVPDFPHDPGCQAAGDDEETDPASAPGCGNGGDDDGDGRIDYPDDPGCAGVGDRDEEDPPVPPACADGQDNDRDGDTDYPQDTGCESAGDGGEEGSCGMRYHPAELVADVDVHTDTSRGVFLSEGSCGGRGAAEVVFVHRVDRVLERLLVRTDLEGTEVETTLYARTGCLDAGTEIACHREELGGETRGHVLDIPAPNPGDYYIFVDGVAQRGGPVTVRVEEVPMAACLNREDDDRDGRADFPNDPGCLASNDRDETDPELPPACADDEDNDQDGLVDYPLDRGCRFAADDDETDICGNGIPVAEYPVGEPFILDDQSVDSSNNFQGSCGGANQTEKVFLYANPVNARLTFSVDYEETAQNTLLYVRRDCLGAELPNACNTGLPPNQRGRIRLDQAPPGDYFIFVDRMFGAGGPFKLSVDVERLPAGCSNGRDDDGDGAIDAEDVGCVDAMDEDERDPPEGLTPACANGDDDDADGELDFPFDPGCIARGDETEDDPETVPQCDNGLDDDADGVIDFPREPGCQGRGDDDEANPRVAAQCSNRLDDDMDGVADYPNEPGCTSAGDTTERNPDPPPVCFNQADDDRDGLADWPFDPGCDAAADPAEEDPARAPACANGQDDDGDARTDFPRDPGCQARGDADEADPMALPQCANGRDDDADGRIDFPDDPGCPFAADSNEMDNGPRLARCADGLDNDDDGDIDTADPGCQDARDNDEADEDPANPPYCADGRDNDGDGLVDWPEDDGCAARGGQCEQGGYGLCGGVCIELLNDANNCGRCGRVCAQGVACENGRCGGIRQIVMACGNPGRPIDEFIRGPLVDLGVQVQAGCVPNDQTQAVVIARGGGGEAGNNAAALRQFIQDGGQVLTEYNISHTVYNAIFQAGIPQGARNGNCQDNVQPAFQFSPQDPFWQDNVFQAVPAGQTGCGYSVVGAQVPGFVPLGGWDANNVSLGYVELGAGRFWFVEADWQDREQAFSDVSRTLMAYMIGGGAVRIE